MDNILIYLEDHHIDTEMTDIDRKKVAKEMSSVIANNVNCFGFKPEDVYKGFEKELKNRYPDGDIEELSAYAKQQLHDIAVCWFSFFGHFPKQVPGLTGYGISVDDRNRASKELAERIVYDESFQNMKNLHDADYIEYQQNPRSFFGWSNSKKYFFEFMKAVNVYMHKTLQQTATKLMYFALYGEHISLPMI